MTDEMIQQIPQQKGNYAVPGLLTGAVVGGVAGAAGAHYKNWGVTSKPDLDKVFAQKPDEFESMAKRAGDNKSKIEQAGEIVKGVQDLEKQYDEKIAELQKTGGITDADLTKDLVNRRNGAQSALDRAIESERNRLSNVTASATELPTRKELLNQLTTEEFKAFEPYLNGYEAAKKKLLGDPGKKFAGGTANVQYTNIANKKKEAAKIYDSFFTRYDALTDANKEKFNPASRPNMKLINAEIDNLLPTSYSKKVGKGSKFNYSQFKEFQRRFGEEMFELTDTKPDDAAGRQVFEVRDPKGKKAYAIVDTELVKAEREALRNSYVENIKNAMDLKTKIKNFDADFFEANKDALAIDFENGIKDAADVKKILGDKDAIKDLKKAIAGIEVMEQSIEKGIEKFPITIGTEVINSKEELEIFKNKTQVARDWAERYVKESHGLQNELKAIISQDPRVASAYTQFKTAIAEDSGVKKSLEAIEKLNGKYATEKQKALYEKIKSLIGTEGVSELSADEIEAKIKEAKSVQNAEAKLQAIKDEIAKYAEEKGLKGEISKEDAIKKFGKTKEEFIKASKDEAKTKLETLLKDVKFGNKWANAAIAGGILALAGLGIGASTSKS